MKKSIALLILAAFAALPIAASAADGFVYADVLSAYVFNGQVGNDEAVFQPGLDVTGPLGLGYSFWANMDLTDSERSWAANSAGEWSELDLGLNWSSPWEGPVSLTIGGTYYVYPQSSSSVDTDDDGAAIVGEDGSVTVSEAPADGSYEVYAKVKATTILLSPALKVCHDLDNTDDWIALFSLSHSFSLTDALSLDLGATLGYAGEFYIDQNYGSDAGSAFTHAQADAALTFALNEKISVSAKASYSSILEDDVRDDIEAGDVYPDVDIFFGGVNVSYSF